MNKPSMNSKTFWPNNKVLEISIERKKIEYLVEKRKLYNAKFSTKLLNLVRKFF